LSFQDKSIKCSDCGTSFIFSIKDQEFFKARGFFREPQRCPDCRDKYNGVARAVVKPVVQELAVITAPAGTVAGTFESFGLNPSVMSGVRLSGYTVPTPIQSQAIPHVLAGKDLMGLAQTGTGKTAAFVLPMLQRLGTHVRGNIRALVISPTRELAEQTNESIASLGRRTGIRGISLYGGVGMYQQVRDLRDGVDAVVACPGRLLDHIWQGSIDLSSVELLVIDEADRMFDMGFLPDIKNILKCLPEKRQTLLFSATMPDDVRKLVQAYLHEPVTVQIGHAAPVSSVSHALYPVKQHLKSALLMQLLRQVETESVVVFTRTKHRAERVAEQLKRAGFNVTSLQGNLAQARRQAAIDNFRRGKAKILVATDIAARGIDVLSISHVINYDMPDTTDAYTHRIGRTGRVDKTGEAFTLVSPEDGEMVRAVERILNKKIERRTLPGFDYAVEAPKIESERHPTRRFGAPSSSNRPFSGERRRVFSRAV
jgi:ATP-dependent RNA helicase RhlE